MRRISKYLINSRDRAIGTSTDFVCYLPETLTDVKKIELLHVSIPSTMYNITSENNTFYFIDGGVDKYYELPPGSYTIEQLVIALLNGLNNMTSLNFYMHYNVIYHKFRIETGSGNIGLRFGTFRSNSIARVLGFKSVDTVLTDVFDSDYAVDLAEPDYYIIDVQEFAPNSKTTSNITGSFIIPCSTLVNGSIELFYKNSTYNYVEFIDTMNLSSLTIKLKDNKNRVIDLNGSDWYIILGLCY